MDGYEYEPTSNYASDFLSDLTDYYEGGDLDTWLMDNYDPLPDDDANYIPTQLSSVFEALAGSQIEYYDIYIQGGYDGSAGIYIHNTVFYPINDERFWPVVDNVEFLDKINLAFPHLESNDTIVSWHNNVQHFAIWSPCWGGVSYCNEWYISGDFTTNAGGLVIYSQSGGNLNWDLAIIED